MENENGIETLRKDNQMRDEVRASNEQSTRNTFVPVLVIFVASSQELVSKVLDFSKDRKIVPV